MNIQVREPVNREAWLRLLGVRGQADEELMERMDEAEKLLKAAAGIRGIYRIMPLAELPIEGRSISRHLAGCHSAAVMAVTLGAGVDSLIRQREITDMSMAVIIDCGASQLIEQACDEFENHIRNESGAYMTSRFSPGYGDYPLKYQKSAVGLVDAQRKIGLNLTEDYLMVPRKSVTAVMGIADHPVEGRPATCGECVLRDKCEIRNEGKYCGD